MHASIIIEERFWENNITFQHYKESTVNRITCHSLKPSRQSFPYHMENDMQGIVPLCHPFQPCPLCDANTRHISTVK